MKKDTSNKAITTRVERASASSTLPDDKASGEPRVRFGKGAVAFALTLGVLAGVGTFTFGYGKGVSYLSNNPQTCVNCHVMQDHLDSWQQSSHHHVAVCNDCHLPYEKKGAMKVSSHWVRSPMMNINKACQTCHNIPEQEIKDRVDLIQDRTRALIDRAAAAMTEMLDAIITAQEAGATEEQLVPIRNLQRKAMWRIDFIASENSKGFHARQEAARILAESVDYSRQTLRPAIS